MAFLCRRSTCATRYVSSFERRSVLAYVLKVDHIAFIGFINSVSHIAAQSPLAISVFNHTPEWNIASFTCLRHTLSFGGGLQSASVRPQ